MGVNSLPKTVTRQRRDCDLNPGLSAPESTTLTSQLPSHPQVYCKPVFKFFLSVFVTSCVPLQHRAWGVRRGGLC